MTENPNVANTETTYVAPANFEPLFTEEELEAIMSPEDAAESLNASEPLSDWFNPGATDNTRWRAENWAGALNTDGWSADRQDQVAQRLLRLIVDLKAEDLKAITYSVECATNSIGEYRVLAVQFTATTLTVLLEGEMGLSPELAAQMVEMVESELESYRRAPHLEVEINCVTAYWAIERLVMDADYELEGVLYYGHDVIVNVTGDHKPDKRAPALDNIREELEEAIAEVVRVEGHIATPQVVVVGDYEDLSSNLFWGGGPADWLVATGTRGPSDATRRWAVDHASTRATTGSSGPERRHVDLAVEILEELKAKAIAQVTASILAVSSAKGFRLAALQFTDKSVTVTLDGTDRVALTREAYAEIVEAIEVSLMHNGATRLNIEIATVVTDFGRASLGYYEAI